MNLIDNYLKKEHQLDVLFDDDETEDVNNRENQNEIKLQYFYNLFVELEKKYTYKIEDMKRLEVEHKAEISNVKF